MKNKTYALATICFLALLWACEEIKVYDEVPEITYKEFRYSDTTLVFEFIDGDGNLGLDSSFKSGPFHFDSSYYYNLFIHFYKFEDNQFSEIEFKSDPHFRFGIIPTPEGNNKTLKGTSEVSLVQIFPIPAPDSFMIKFYIVDRELNESNLDSTGMLTLSEFYLLQ